MNILVSACLLGVECRYNGKGALAPAVKELLKHHQLIQGEGVCAERLKKHGIKVFGESELSLDERY